VAAKKATPAKKLSFSEAVDEVEEILSRLEREAVDIDDLSTEVKRAVELIQVCRAKLDKTDTEVRELVADLQSDTDDRSADGNAGADAAGDAGTTDDSESGKDLPF